MGQNTEISSSEAFSEKLLQGTTACNCLILQCYSHNCSTDTRVTAHSQVIIAAPDRHLFLSDQRVSVVICHGEDLCLPVHCFEHSVGVILLLFIDLLLKELIVLEGGYS